MKKIETKVLGLEKVETIVRTHQTFISREKRHETLTLQEPKSIRNISIAKQKNGNFLLVSILEFVFQEAQNAYGSLSFRNEHGY